VALLDSQLAALEPPGADENAIRIDVAVPVADQADSVIAALAPERA
jgi:gluconokinase